MFTMPLFSFIIHAWLKLGEKSTFNIGMWEVWDPMFQVGMQISQGFLNEDSSWLASSQARRICQFSMLIPMFKRSGLPGMMRALCDGVHLPDEACTR